MTIKRDMFDQHSTFLTLPLELRLQIYAEVYSQWLKYDPQYHLSIASVCKQIRREAFPLILQKPRYLWSGGHLWKWTSQGAQKHLDLINDVSVNFVGSSLSEFWTLKHEHKHALKGANETVPNSGEWWEATYLQRVNPQNPKPVSVWNSLNKTITKYLIFKSKRGSKDRPKSAVVSTWEAFNSLPNIQKLRIGFQSPNRGYPLDSTREQQLILEMIPLACPNVQSLTLFFSSGLLNLSYLINFYNLQHLSFNGNYNSSSEEALKILQSLKHLNSLTIERNVESYTAEEEHYSNNSSIIPPYLSLTPYVIENMNPLKSLTISHTSFQAPSYHLSSPMAAALTKHKNSLRTLSIDAHVPVNEDFVLGLLNFISSSNITDLAIRLRIPKSLSALDFSSYFPRTINHRHTEIVEAEEYEIQQLPWMREIINLDMSGPVRSVGGSEIPVPSVAPSASSSSDSS